MKTRRQIVLAAITLLVFLGACSLDSGTDFKANQDISAAVVSGTSPVAQHGDLSVSGSKIVDRNGNPVYLKGMSFFWSQWSGSFWNASAVETLADDWGCTIVRAAMGVESGGYLSNPEAEKARVRTVVDAAVANGIYVIIDWHDHDAPNHQAESVAFFREMAREYKDTPNVLFEIFNEPDYESWDQVKSYAVPVIQAIRDEGADNIIIVGTTTWCQDVDTASNSPITGFDNIAYTLHFYAASPEHQAPLMNRARTAIANGLPLFATEWGTCEYTGNGKVDLSYSQEWIDFLEANSISWCNWSLFDKDEAASALKPGSSPTGPWPDSALTVSGAFIKEQIGGDIIIDPVEEQEPYHGSPYLINQTVTIQAEDYDLGGSNVAYSDSDASNNGNAYRTDAVDIQVCGEGGYNVGWTVAGEWLEYTIEIPSDGLYSAEFRMASMQNGRSFHMEIDGNNVTGPLTYNGKSDWQDYLTVSGGTFSLTQGVKVMRIAFDSNANNINWITLSPEGQQTVDPTISRSSASFDKNPSAGEDITVTMNPGDQTFSGLTNGGEQLTAGTDYTVSGNTVTIRKSYLSTLAVGSDQITFNFTGSVDPVLNLTITDSSVVPEDGLTVEFYSGEKGSSSSTLAPRIRLVNNGTSPINLADVTLKYYFTKDANKALNFWCDHAGGQLNGGYSSITSSVQGSFAAVSGTKTDTAAVIGFTSSAGTLAPGGFVDLQIRITRGDWSSFNQSNDYSFNASASSFVPWNNVTAAVGGTTVWGIEP